MTLKVRQLGSGQYSDCFKVSDGMGRAVALKVSYYRDSTIRAVTSHVEHGDIAAANTVMDQDAVSVATSIAAVAMTMKQHNVTPHIVVVYGDADAPDVPARLAPLLNARLPSLTPRQYKYSHLCVMELCACTMKTFVASSALATDRVTRCLIFQVLYTLACLQRVLPGFRHNDLSANNVLVRRLPQPLTTTYVISGNKIARMHNMTVAVALADFDFTHVPHHSILANERILGKKYGIGQEANEGYDTHLFLASLKKAVGKGRLDKTRAFLECIKLGSTSRTHIRAAHLDPMRLMMHPYFDVLFSGADAGPAKVGETYIMPST